MIDSMRFVVSIGSSMLRTVHPRIADCKHKMKIVEKRFDKVDDRFERIDLRLDVLEKDIKDSRLLSWSHFRWIMGTTVALLVTFVSVLIRGHLS